MKLSEAIEVTERYLSHRDDGAIRTLLLASKQLLKEHGDDYMDRLGIPTYDELAVCDAVMRGLEKNHELMGLLHKIADHR